MAPAKMKLRARKKEGRSSKSSRQQALQPEASPDSKCPICLDRFVNVASVERCLHRFCFRCIREWAKNKAECPLCKQPFRSIFHSVRSENDFKEYVVLESAAENITTSGSTAVTTSTPTPTTPPATHNHAENSSSRTRRSAAARFQDRRRAQNPAPSGSSLDEGALQNLLPWLQQDRVMGVGQLRPFLLARTDHILHKLVNFARSIEAMQCPPAPSYEEDSGSPSSIINISEDEDSDAPDVSEVATPERVASIPMPTSSEISLSQSAWDDETPGPSYSTLSQLQSEAAESGASQQGGTNESEERHEHNHDEEECMIVGYVKPMAERTPELVHLSSDSSEEEQEKEAPATEVPKPLTKVELPVQSAPSLKSFPSTSHTETVERGVEKHPHHSRRDHTRGRGLRNRSHSSSDSSEPSGRPQNSDRPRPGLLRKELKRRGERSINLSSAYRVSSSDEDLARPPEKSSSSFSPWDSPGHKRARDGRKKRRRTRKRERPSDRSRSPRDPRRRRGDRAPRFRSSDTGSSSEEWRPEKPGGKCKYKTRHLEKRVQRESGKRERERSPSVEIIYERPALDAHPRRRRKSRHKKKSRRRSRGQNSPTVITIDSDSTNAQDLFTEDCLTDCKEKDTDANGWRTYNHKDYVSVFSGLTADYEQRLKDFRDRLMYRKDLKGQTNASRADNHQVGGAEVSVHADCKGAVAKDPREPGAEVSGNTVVFNDLVSGNTADGQRRDQVVAVSSSTSDHPNCKLSSSTHTTDYLHDSWLSKSLTDPQGRTPETTDRTSDVQAGVLVPSGHMTDAGGHAADQKRGAEVSMHTADPEDRTGKGRDDCRDYKESIQGVSCQDRTLGVSSTEVSSRTAPHLDFQDAGASLKTLSGQSPDTLNLEDFLVDIVNPKPVDIQSGEGRDRREAGNAPHRDQSRAEDDPEATSDSHDVQ